VYSDASLFDVFYYKLIMDKTAIVEFLLQNRYIQENQALQFEVEALAAQLAAANRTIARLERNLEYSLEREQDLETERNTLANTTRILIDRNGDQHLFRLNDHNVFEEYFDEPIRSVRRRLEPEFEQTEDELMEQLMFGTP
jgi:hypothetical protein